MMNVTKQLLLGLGSNLGDRKDVLLKSIKEIELAFKSSAIVSSFYESEPWGFESENPFLNCCVSLYCDLSPKEVLKHTQAIEMKLGRVKKSKNGNYESRPIDIDILYYGNHIVADEKLSIPHPLLYHRAFVLKPLSEISPDFQDPLKKQSIREIWTTCNDKNSVVLLDE